MEFIDRSESRYFDILYLSIEALLLAEEPLTRYEIWDEILLPSVIKNKPFEISPCIIKETLINYGEKSGRKYVRTLSDSWLALDVVEDIYKKKYLESSSINHYSELNLDFFNPLKNSQKSKYKRLQNTEIFKDTKFASKEWLLLLKKRAERYGYFLRYIDVMLILKKYLETSKTSLKYQKNLIGPYDKKIPGGGPDFVQSTFLAWAFFLDFLTIKSARLKEYDFAKKQQYLIDKKGLFSINSEYRILPNTTSYFDFELHDSLPNEKIRVCGVHRFVNWEYQELDSEMKIGFSLIRIRLLYLLDFKQYKIENLYSDSVIKEIISYYNLDDIDFIEHLLYLECMGMQYSVGNHWSSITECIFDFLLRLEDSFLDELSQQKKYSPLILNYKKNRNKIKLNNFQIKSNRRFDKVHFETSLPKGTLFQSITLV